MPRRAAIRALLFDKDGTLFDFRQVWLPIYRAAAAEAAAAAGAPGLAPRLLRAAGYDAASDSFEARSCLISGTPAEIAEFWRAELGAGAPADLTERMVRTFDALSSREQAPVTDLEALFGALSGRGFHLGIASMDSDAALRATLAHGRWARHIAFACGYDTGHGVKPEPGMVRAFARALGVAAAEVAVIGDSLRDIEMARAAGAGLAIAVATGPTPAARLAEAADHLLPDIAALPAFFADASPC